MDQSMVTRQIKNFLMNERGMDLVGICPASALDGEPEGYRPTDILFCCSWILFANAWSMHSCKVHVR